MQPNATLHSRLRPSDCGRRLVRPPQRDFRHLRCCFASYTALEVWIEDVLLASIWNTNIVGGPNATALFGTNYLLGAVRIRQVRVKQVGP